jgi:hypothetical protein
MTRSRSVSVVLAFTAALAGAFGGCNALLANDPGILLVSDESGTLPEPDAATTPAPAPEEDAAPAPPADANANAATAPPADAGAPADAGPAPCAPNERRCGSRCVSSADPAFGCGAANCTPCALARATPTCVAGACAVARCATGFADCNGSGADGCETDLSRTASCGACDAVCPALPNAIVACKLGRCTATCGAPFRTCAGRCVAPDDPTACGPACLPCPVLPNTRAACAANVCGLACEAQFGDCDLQPLNGCETPLDTSPVHCGACGKACPSGVCAAGICVPKAPDAG